MSTVVVVRDGAFAVCRFRLSRAGDLYHLLFCLEYNVNGVWTELRYDPPGVCLVLRGATSPELGISPYVLSDLSEYTIMLGSRAIYRLRPGHYGRAESGCTASEA